MHNETKIIEHIIIYGQPITKKNSQVVKCINNKPIIIQSKAYRNYEKMCLNELRFYKGTRFTGPVEIAAHYWLKDKRRPDLTNLMAATADILEKARIIRNDQDIVSWDGTKIIGLSPQPRVEIHISSCEPL